MSTTDQRKLLEAAESYSRDARKFRDAVRLARPILSAEQDGYWATVYREIARELRKVAAQMPSTEPSPDAVARYLAHHGTPTTVPAGA